MLKFIKHSTKMKKKYSLDSESIQIKNNSNDIPHEK